MAVRTRDEIMNLLNERLGDDSSDETIAFIEDMTDTLDDLQNKSNSGGEDWKTKYEENDKEWRKRYRERFFSGGTSNDPTGIEDKPKPKKRTFENLFKKGDK